MSSHKCRFKRRKVYSDTHDSYKYRDRVSTLVILRALKLPVFLVCPVIVLLVTFSPVSGADISVPELTTRNGELFVDAFLSLDDKYIQELRNGMKKEFHCYISLYRVWGMWPDEFITGKQIIRNLKADPVKTEFVAKSNDGSTVLRKRFKSFESMMIWAQRFEDEHLVDIRDLEPGTYYVQVRVESKIRRLPPVIGYFMFFVKENEFMVRKNSLHFTTGSSP